MILRLYWEMILIYFKINYNNKYVDQKLNSAGFSFDICD